MTAPITTRDKVLQLVQQGLSSAEIAKAIGVGYNTVIKHRKALRVDGRLPEYQVGSSRTIDK